MPSKHWSDAPAFDGTMTIMQPLIAPLYGGKSAHDILNAFSETPELPATKPARLLALQKHTGTDFDNWWKNRFTTAG